MASLATCSVPVNYTLPTSSDSSAASSVKKPIKGATKPCFGCGCGDGDCDCFICDWDLWPREDAFDQIVGGTPLMGGSVEGGRLPLTSISRWWVSVCPVNQSFIWSFSMCYLA